MDRQIFTQCVLIFSLCSIISNVSSATIEDAIKGNHKEEPKVDNLNGTKINIHEINQFGPESRNEKELCTSTVKLVYPQKAKSKEGEFEYVVNNDELRQSVMVQICNTPGGRCNELPSAFGYNFKCVQKYHIQSLVVLNRNSSEVQGFVTKRFEFPSGCSCVITEGGHEDQQDNQTTGRPVNEKP